MRIHRLTVRNFRRITDRTVELPETGTTVIVGDNEVGKSTLIEALVLLFDLADDSKAARVRTVQPFGSDVGPEVEAELTLGESHLTYAKRWLRGKSTELTVTGRDGARRSYTGREAHNEADRLFRANVDAVLWQTLLVGQGQSLIQPAPADAEPLIAAVNAESGTPVDGASVPLVLAVEQEYLRYWTKGGRPTGDFARGAEDLATHESAAQAAREAMTKVNEDIRRAERLAQDLVDLRRRLDEQAAAVDEADRLARLGEALTARRDAAAQKADTARARLENRTAARVERDRLVGEVDRRTAIVAELRDRLTETEPAAQAHAATLRDSQSLLASALELRDERRAAVQEAEIRLARLADRAELNRLTERQAELDDVRTRITAARAVVESCLVTDELLAELEEARAAMVIARAALDAGAPEVLVRRLGGPAVQVSDDSTLFGTEVTGTKPVSQRVAGEMQIVVPGQLEVTVRAGGEVASLRKAVDAATRAERDLLTQAGAEDLRGARELVRRRDAAAAELAEARRTERSLLTQGDPAERIAVLTARLAVDEAGEMDLAAARAELEELRAALAEADRIVTEAEFAEGQARKAADDDRSAAMRANAQLEVETDRLAGATETLAEARGTIADDDVLTAETDAVEAVQTLLAELDSLQAEVDDLLPTRLADARQVLAQLRTEYEDLRDDLRLTEGRLQQSGTDGLATRLDTAEVALDRSRTGYEMLRRRADAARRVRDTLARHRTEAQNRYAAPLRSRIEALGRTVYGPTFTVALDDDLAVSERELNGVRLNVEELSTGAREQLAIITRLAISHLVGSGDEHVPAIFDDALGWSDKGRLREMGALLGRAGEHGQVIVLTCVPERYDYVPGRHVIRLTA
jgi:chromosome segregation ATPase